MRCYNGQPDSQLQAVLDERQRLRKRLAQYDVRCVFFPGHKAHWQAWSHNRPVCGWTEEFSSMEGAALAALKILEANDGRA